MADVVHVAESAGRRGRTVIQTAVAVGWRPAQQG